MGLLLGLVDMIISCDCSLMRLIERDWQRAMMEVD